jgi:hypothetical protein
MYSLHRHADSLTIGEADGIFSAAVQLNADRFLTSVC